MEVNKYINKGHVVSFSNFKRDDFKDYEIITTEILDSDTLVLDYMESLGYNLEKIKASLQMVNGEEKLLTRNLLTLSSSEILRVKLMQKLMDNEEVIILENWDRYFMEKDWQFFKKLFKKLAKRYNKAIGIISDNVGFMIDLVDMLVIKKSENEVLEFSGKDFYNEKIYKYLDKPKVIDFVSYLKKNNKNLDYYNYVEMKELLKAIYRKG